MSLRKKNTQSTCQCVQMNGSDASTQSDGRPTAKCEWRASLQKISLIMGIIAIRLLDVRLAWQPHNDCLCAAKHNTPHLAPSIDNIHTDGAVCHIWDEAHTHKNTTACWQRVGLCLVSFDKSASLWSSVLWRHNVLICMLFIGYLHFIVSKRFWGRESLFLVSDPVRSYEI